MIEVAKRVFLTVAEVYYATASLAILMMLCHELLG